MPATPLPVSRRLFLMQSAGAAAATTFAGGATFTHAAPWDHPGIPAAPSVSLPVVDTHTHFYDPTRPEGVPWPGRDDTFLYRPVLPDEYQKLTAPEGVVGTVVVEASSRVEDNQWLLDLADRKPLLLAIVGHLDPGTETFRPLLERFAARKRFRGIRIGHGALKTGLEERRFLDDLKAFSRLGLTLDINGGPDMLPDIARLANRLPDLKIVVNHLANVRIDGESPPEDWRRGLRDAARHPRVWCKLSALVEGASRPEMPSPTEPAYYRPVLDAAWATFGAERLVYGSNWPVSARFGSYQTVQTLAVAFARAMGEETARKIMHDNAQQAYQWPAP